MENILKWSIISILILLVFTFTLIRTPEEISKMLINVTQKYSLLAIILHLLFLAVFIVGLLIKKIRNVVFSLFILMISLSAFIISIINMILPNIIIFGLFSVFIIIALIKKQLNFDLESIRLINKIIGFTAIFFGFWYLHWIKEPLFLNAILYSPIGIVNCPTMVAICGFLCLTKNPRSIILDATVSVSTLYFGFLGLFRLNVYIDIVLIISALFLLIRLVSQIDYYNTFEKN